MQLRRQLLLWPSLLNVAFAINILRQFSNPVVSPGRVDQPPPFITLDLKVHKQKVHNNLLLESENFDSFKAIGPRIGWAPGSDQGANDLKDGIGVRHLDFIKDLYMKEFNISMEERMGPKLTVDSMAGLRNGGELFISGHGNWGAGIGSHDQNLTPEQIVDELMEANFPTEPTQPVYIYLIACWGNVKVTERNRFDLFGLFKKRQEPALYRLASALYGKTKNVIAVAWDGPMGGIWTEKMRKFMATQKKILDRFGGEGSAITKSDIPKLPKDFYLAPKKGESADHIITKDDYGPPAIRALPDDLQVVDKTFENGQMHFLFLSDDQMYAAYRIDANTCMRVHGTPKKVRKKGWKFNVIESNKKSRWKSCKRNE